MVPLKTLLVGGGMIAHDQILPSLYHLQREGLIGEIAVCAQTGRTTKALADNQTIRDAFPGQDFTPYPDYNTVGDLTRKHPHLYKELLEELPPRQLVVMALPDQLHYECIKAALNANQHVLAVKPLVLSYRHAKDLEALAFSKGLFVGIDYHKRFDDRTLMARMAYQAGKFGNFRLGQASLVEPWYYRDSNFQNWCTCDNTDLFTYVGCHYVDQVAFITGHQPVEVSVYGIVDTYPNGAAGYLWTDARVIWDNGGCLNVIDAIGYPNHGAGGNTQGIKLLGQGSDDGTLLIHDDQFRGLQYCYAEGEGPVNKRYHEPSPDYFKLVYRGGKGLVPVGYGHRSIEGLVNATQRVEMHEALADRQAEIQQIDAEGIIATPANSAYNELVIEAARLSITHDARPVAIHYGDQPGVRFKEW